jgi:rhodanese-related sulfurtransferase
MMGNWGGDGFYGAPWGQPYRNDVKPLSLDEAKTAAEAFLADLDKNLELGEVMEFSNHFYADAREKDTGRGAIEFLMDRYTGAARPEMGPNMMWNEKYGMMRGDRSLKPSDMKVSPEKAIKYAQRYLERSEPGLTADANVKDVETYYGYYTLHVLKDGKVYGMLSVNGDTGRVWYHSWHGDFVAMTEESGEGMSMPQTPAKPETPTATETPATSSTKPTSYTELTAAELAKMLENKEFTLINVHIPYAGELPKTDLFIPYDKIKQNADLLPADKDTRIVLYCRSGNMSATASQTLTEMGYTRVYNLTPGMEDWKATGYELIEKKQ